VSARPLNRISVAVACLIVLVFAGFVADKFWLSGHVTAEAPPNANATTVNERSIAVLPFADMSEKKDQEYFSDGLAETLLDQLAKTPGLHVIARTSSFSFKGKSDDVPTLAHKLHVAYLLEGSVRKFGNRLRVSTQLIRASDGEHLWSETYDRELADVLQIQDEIADAVVAALNLKLSARQPSVSHATSNPEAYNEYLLGRQFYLRGNVEGYRRAVEAFQKAIALDPHYASAYAELSGAESNLAAETEDATGYLRAEAAADQAVSLAPEAAEGYWARGKIRHELTWDWVGAQTDYEKALVLDPGRASTYASYGSLLNSRGRQPEALAALRKATELDPLASRAWATLSFAYLASRNLPAAREASRRALEISPDATWALNILVRLQLIEGEGAEALVTSRKIANRVFYLTGTAEAEHTLGHAKESQQALEELKSKFAGDAAFQVAEVYAWRGETDAALEWLDRAYAERDSGLIFLLSDPMFGSVRSDPRFRALLRKMKLPE
jgi:TolB-like protein/Tfp pilus assembly protein PilF